METVIEIAINQISLTNESIIEATFDFKCQNNVWKFDHSPGQK